MYITRKIEEEIISHLQTQNDILVIYGARQVGKTTLVKKVLEKISFKSLQVNAEELKHQLVFSSRDLAMMQSVVEGYELVFIDEAQSIENIGVNIKILHDALPNLKIILSGSSSFDLSNKIKEPLTGRTKTFMLYPLGFIELVNLYNSFELKEHLKQALIIGGYPRLYSLQTLQEKIAHLNELASAYLYKDVLQFTKIKHAKKLKSQNTLMKKD